MGVDCHCLIDVTLSEKDIFSLPDEVMALPGRLDGLYDHLWTTWQEVEGLPAEKERLWKLDEYNYLEDSDDYSDFGLSGPFGLGGRLMQHAISIDHLNRWRQFLENHQGMRDRFRRSCQLIAHELGANRIVYLSEAGLDLIVEHAQWRRSFDELLTFLESHWGPLPSIAKLTGTSDVRRDFYFLEYLDARP